MAKRISEKQKQEIIEDFVNKKNLEEISEKFQFTKLTITRNLKKILGEKKFNELLEYTKPSKELKLNENMVLSEDNDSNFNLQPSVDSLNEELYPRETFLEIAPLNLEIDNLPQRDLSSVSINEVELPKIVYMVVNKHVELETKFLKEYAEWNFLSEKELSRKTIEIFFDMKAAKRSINKEQRVIKVPNSDVFKITASILKARGISRIVSSEVLIAL